MSFGTFLADHAPSIVYGLKFTMMVSLFSIVMGTLLGTGAGLILSSNRTAIAFVCLRETTRAIVYLFLAIPPLALVYIAYYNRWLKWLDPFGAATLALGLNLAPFVAQIVATGVKNIDVELLNAAKAQGYSNFQIGYKFKLPLVRALGGHRKPANEGRLKTGQ